MCFRCGTVARKTEPVSRLTTYLTNFFWMAMQNSPRETGFPEENSLNLVAFMFEISSAAPGCFHECCTAFAGGLATDMSHSLQRVDLKIRAVPGCPRTPVKTKSGNFDKSTHPGKTRQPSPLVVSYRRGLWRTAPKNTKQRALSLPGLHVSVMYRFRLWPCQLHFSSGKKRSRTTSGRP